MGQLTVKDKKEIYRLRAFFPGNVGMRVRRSKDGGFSAAVTTFPGVFTEADTFSELIGMVNDAVMTYFEVPRRYVSFMPSYIPPLRAAQAFGAFPMFEKEKNFRLERASPS
ncbi:MAG: hypothetical protein A3A44_01235 [Candidatus Sungbacteria bacterium RIFCSPLOWO2_01_FULL_60_25]|uniref:Uncharacterized protein n=1 Tax=Candidatus Sungbacteria bacterium RIFCSPLOWO2_01_FULL_60_25 TaxID=1802281 RepID=A0A1G2LHA1_9BACT|nr:MAG: hypothetical protein A3A44_01235 [Candidatus Sungbacteria bacterium RIFCSPLOWO2_01_FULL_60_25]